MKKEKTTIPLLTGLAAIIISVVLFSSTISQEIYALATSDSANQNNLQQLQDAKEKITKLMSNNPNPTTNAVKVSESGGIPVVGTFVDGGTSQLVVTVYDKAPLSLDIYEKRVSAIVGDIPLRVEFGHVEFINGGTNLCNSQTSNCNPVIGGLQVQPVSGASTPTTLGLPVYDSSSNTGFIMAAHGIDPNNCGTTGSINQGGVTVGSVTINPPSPRQSDSAFVKLNSGQVFGQYQIYAGSRSYWYASSMVPSSQQAYQTQVAMQGLTSGYKTGYIVSVGTILLRVIYVIQTV